MHALQNSGIMSERESTRSPLRGTARELIPQELGVQGPLGGLSEVEVDSTDELNGRDLYADGEEVDASQVRSSAKPKRQVRRRNSSSSSPYGREGSSPRARSAEPDISHERGRSVA